MEEIQKQDFILIRAKDVQKKLTAFQLDLEDFIREMEGDENQNPAS